MDEIKNKLTKLYNGNTIEPKGKANGLKPSEL